MSRWPGEPARCTCTRVIVPDLAGTLACPLGWRYWPAYGWIHTMPGRPS